MQSPVAVRLPSAKANAKIQPWADPNCCDDAFASDEGADCLLESDVMYQDLSCYPYFAAVTNQGQSCYCLLWSVI